MSKRPIAAISRARPGISRSRSIARNRSARADGIPNQDGATDQTSSIIDQCVAAKEAADAIGEKFLSYLLAMTIQEGHAVIRRVGSDGRQA